jgi:molecular chaperone GrpE
MAGDPNTTHNGTVSPGAQHPGADAPVPPPLSEGPTVPAPGQAPATPGQVPVAGQAPAEASAAPTEVTTPEPAVDPEAPVAPSAPAGDPEAPVAPPTPVEDPGPQSPPVSDPGPPRDIAELSARAEKADEYLELARRTKADFENYRKRAARDAAAAQERGITKLVKELLPAVDNLDRAVQAAESAAAGENGANGTDTLVSGIKLVHADVLAALQRAGVERFSPQALAQQPVEGAQPGTVVEVYQQGYRLGELVIRPARVVVAG